MAMKNFVFLGAPGAGKGTMADLLCEKRGFAHISTGDLLRAELKNGTELGLKAKSFMESGKLVPDEVVAAMVSAKLGSTEIQQRGFILDGYPRTVNQADLLARALTAISQKLDVVVLFEVERELLLKRLTARRLCRKCPAIYNTIYGPPAKEGICDQCGGELYQRADDTLKTAVDRLAVYETETMPLIALYEQQKLLVRVSGSEEKNANFALMCQKLVL